MVLATNALGGRVVTTAFFASGFGWQPALTDMRKEWFLKALSRIGWNDYAVLNDQDALALERRCADGSVLLAVFNTNFDEMETIRVRVPCTPESVEVLVPGGEWRHVDAKFVSGEMEIPVRLPCSHACVLRIH